MIGKYPQRKWGGQDYFCFVLLSLPLLLHWRMRWELVFFLKKKKLRIITLTFWDPKNDPTRNSTIGKLLPRLEGGVK